MPEIYNLYCDESCHLEKDRQRAMVLGALRCPADKAREVAVRLREIKREHGAAPGMEIKWTKTSPGGLRLYSALVDYFFDDDDLSFRCLIVPDKNRLDHARFGQSHDEWYYKMQFQLLAPIIDPRAKQRIYIDIKDTRSADKVAKLHQILCNARYDFERRVIERVQQVRSHEVEEIQLADLLTGAVSYANRGLAGSAAKAAVVKRIRERSRYSLVRNTLLQEKKFNVFRWTPT